MIRSTTRTGVCASRNRRGLIEPLEQRTLLANIVVNTIIDGIFPPGSGLISLRSAVQTANSAADATTITFDPTVFSSLQTISLNGSLLELSNTSKPTTITGPAAGVIVSGDGKSGVFQIDSTVTASISGVTITKGNSGKGGGVYNHGGTLTLKNVTVSNSEATDTNYGGGGGIFNDTTSTLTLTNVTITGNTSSGNGGGIYNYGEFGTTKLTLTNVTISGNAAGGRGGGIHCLGYGTVTTTLNNSTISNNTAWGGGGIANDDSHPATVTMTNTVVAGNSLSPAGGSGPDAFGSFNSLSHNLIGKTDGSTGFSALDIRGTIASPKDPKLGSLANNGGLTLTRLPLTGSPAIDAGMNSLVPAGTTTDQRGKTRIANGTVDIGAVEVQSGGGDPGSIAGQKFNDLDGDGVKDAGEGGLSGWTIFLDTDKDGVKDAAEKSVTTDASGNFKFADLAAGSYRVREVGKTGWRRTTPSSGYIDVTLAAAQNVTGKNFGNTQKVLISGTKWNDLDKDGVKDSGEPGLANWRIYIDTDKDGVWDATEKSVLTSASGEYSFKDLTAGTYRVREVGQSNWTQTAPSLKYYDVTLAAGASATGKNFGNASGGSISGKLFSDDGDGKLEAGEGGLQYRRIFIDADKDGVYDPEEKFAITDASGNWSISGLAAGTYVVRMVKQAGWNVTTPATAAVTIALTAGQIKTGVLFGEHHI